MHATVKSCGVSATDGRGQMTIQPPGAGGASGFFRSRKVRGNLPSRISRAFPSTFVVSSSDHTQFRASFENILANTCPFAANINFNHTLPRDSQLWSSAFTENVLDGLNFATGANTNSTFGTIASVALPARSEARVVDW